MDYAKFVEQMRVIMRNPDPAKDCRAFAKWEKGAITTKGCWRSFIKNNGWTLEEWKYIRDDVLFEWYLNGLGYWRSEKEEEGQNEPGDIQ